MNIKELSIYKQAFKAYDIRNLYEQIIDESFAYIMGKAIGRHMKESYDPLVSKFLIGGDTRLANNNLISYFVAGMEEVGYYNITVADQDPRSGYESGKELSFGVCSSSALYYIGRNDFTMSVVFSASHNPKEYVGMKFFDKDVTFLSSAVLLEWFTFAYNQTTEVPDEVVVEVDGSELVMKKKEQLYNFLYAKYQHLNKYHQFAVDYSNGAAVTVEKEFCDDYLVANNHRIMSLNDTPDGTFPNHISDTLEEENYDQLIHVVKNNGLEFGVMFDGDADRIGIVTQTGRLIRGDILVAIIAKQLLEHYETPNAFDKIIIKDVMSTRTIDATVENYHGKLLVNRMGRFYINEAMKKNNALFGGELSGHYMYPELGGAEQVLLSLYYVMKESENFSDFDAMLDAYQVYPKSPSINLVVTDPDDVLDAVYEKFSSYNPQRIDGVNVFSDDFFVTARKSNTEPIVRLVVEANNTQLYDQKLQELMSVVEEFVVDKH